MGEELERVPEIVSESTISEITVEFILLYGTRQQHVNLQWVSAQLVLWLFTTEQKQQ